MFACGYTSSVFYCSPKFEHLRGPWEKSRHITACERTHVGWWEVTLLLTEGLNFLTGWNSGRRCFHQLYFFNQSDTCTTAIPRVLWGHTTSWERHALGRRRGCPWPWRDVLGGTIGRLWTNGTQGWHPSIASRLRLQTPGRSDSEPCVSTLRLCDTHRASVSSAVTWGNSRGNL